MRVVRLWRHRAQGSREVIHVVLIAPGRAHGAPHRIRKLFKRLRPNERRIVVPPDVALCAAHEHHRRCIAAGGRAVHVYALEGISVLMRARAHVFSRWSRYARTSAACTGSIVNATPQTTSSRGNGSALEKPSQSA